MALPRSFASAFWLGLAIASADYISLGLLAQDAPPAQPVTEKRISYVEQIEPIFRAKCQGCHQPAKAEGGLDLTNPAALMAGGDSGLSIEIGKPDTSHLISEITPKDGKAEMPKDQPPLSQVEIDLVRQWILEGANSGDWKPRGPLFDDAHPPVYASPPVITALAFSPDGKWLALSGYHEVLLLDAASYQLVQRLIGRSERIEDFAFSPDSKLLAVAGGTPGVSGELQLWNLETKKLQRSLSQGSDTMYGVSFSPDGSLLSTGGVDNSVRAFKTSNLEQVAFSATHEDWALDTVFSLKGDHLISVSRDRSMKLVHVPTQRFVDNITSITPGAQKGGLMAVDRHPSREEVLIGGADSIPKIYKIFREKQRQIGDDFNLIRALPAMTGRVFDVQYSLDGSRIVAASSEHLKGRLSIYNPEDAALIASIEVSDGGLYAAAFSNDAKRVVTGGASGKVLVLDATNGQTITTLDLLALVGISGGQVAQ